MGNQNCPNYFCPPDDKPEKELQPKGPQQNQQKQTHRGLPQQRSSQIYEPKEHKKSQQEEWRNLLDIQCSKSIQRKGKVCRQQHQITSYCNNELCQEHAAMCNERRCSCFFRHIRCSKVDLQQFKMHMFENQKEIIIKMLSYEKGITDRLAQSRKQFIQNTKFFQIQESSSYKGKDINKILKQLQQSKINLLSIEQQVKPFQQQLQRIMHQLEQARRRLIYKFLPHKQGHPLYELPLPYNQVCKFEVPSKILFDDNEGKQQMSFLVRQLGCPSQLKLKFRASQHDFLASKFHDYCDGIKDTVTIVSTQTNRIIAAYTPLEWNKFSESYLPDYSLQSFILQLSSKQKFPLKQNEKQYAIFNSRYRGPTFGEGHDLYIEDQCQLSSGSYLKFFSSYGQGSTTFGQSQFKVLQYEVYAVIK